MISYAIRGGPSKRADYVAGAFLIKHEEVEGGGGAARMSQQPLMSSFSALEFHAEHYKGAASLAVAAEASRSSSDRAAILVNRFIMPEGRVSRVADTLSKRLSAFGRAGSYLIS